MAISVRPITGGSIKISRVVGSAPVTVKPAAQKETSVKVIFNGPPGRKGLTAATEWAQSEW